MNKSLFDQVAAILQGIDAEQTTDDNGWWENSEGAKFGAEKLRELRALLEGRASLPGGEWVMHMLEDRWPDSGERVEVEAFADWLREVLAAPTVKAEQADDRAECIADGLSVGMSQEEAEEFADKIAAPSLPAAGSAVEEVEVVAWRTNRDEDGTFPRLHKTEQEAKRWVDVCNVGPAITHEPLMTVAQHERIVAALSAQQSAPELVSVPTDAELVEIASKLGALPELCFTEDHPDVRWRIRPEVRELARALLASHGRAEA